MFCVHEKSIGTKKPHFSGAVRPLLEAFLRRRESKVIAPVEMGQVKKYWGWASFFSPAGGSAGLLGIAKGRKKTVGGYFSRNARSAVRDLENFATCGFRERAGEMIIKKTVKALVDFPNLIIIK